MLKNVKFLQKVLIEKEGQFLFIQRSATDDVNPSKWDLPGGNVEDGEDIQQALIREVAEETGLVITTPQPIFLYSFARDGVYAIIVIYKIQYQSGSVMLSPEHQNQVWVTKDNIFDLDLQPWLHDDLKNNWDLI